MPGALARDEIPGSYRRRKGVELVISEFEIQPETYSQILSSRKHVELFVHKESLLGRCDSTMSDSQPLACL